MPLVDSLQFSSLGTALASLKQWGGGRKVDSFSPEADLLNAKNIDPRMVPKAPMSAENIDVHLLSELGKIGLKRGKQITAESHPEIMRDWLELCQRAGLKHPPQLILAESGVLNALTHGNEETAVTTELLKLLNLRELDAVHAHELGHASSKHESLRIGAVITGILLGAGLGYTAAETRGFKTLFQKSQNAASHLKPVSWLVSMISTITGGYVGTLIAKQFSVRPTELEADEKAARISGDPQGLVNALRKLDAVQHSRGNRFSRMFSHIESGYPSINQRINRLEKMAAKMSTYPVTGAREPIPHVGLQQPGSQISAIEGTERLTSPLEHDIAIG